ncbi:MAG TPA: TfoX/Sxy family DNA transformation protein [Rhodothermales bacterium]|nr:TfoX/Sxy family DNA transformation protein [Rhodothermales bacterium]
MQPDTPVEELKNIGPKSAAWLREVGVQTRADLERIGPVFAYLLVRHRFPSAGINLLMAYALHGALTDEAYFALSPETREALRVEVETAALEIAYAPPNE